ncbi:MAG: OmpA family protein, partial [Blastocatellia bacterium]
AQGRDRQRTQPQTSQPASTTLDKARSQATQNTNSQGQQYNIARVPPGKKHKIDGIIVDRGVDSIIVRDKAGSEVMVVLTGATKVKEEKRNLFRGAKTYPATALLRGLVLEIEGRGDNSGALVAEKIKFTDDNFDEARSLDSRVAPVEGRVTGVEGRVTGAEGRLDTAESRMTSAESRLTATEQNAQRLSGQIEELAAVANTARGGAKAAQETADAAMAATSATNDRISTLDDFEAKKNIAVNFKVGSATLSDEAKAALDEIATQAKSEKGFIIQVTGFASADGSEEANRRLSQRRADAVVRYLAMNQEIPLRRIITPFGYGETRPVGDDSTREGREQNRRVEVAVLVNKGLTTPAANSPTQSTSASPQRQRTNNE